MKQRTKARTSTTTAARPPRAIEPRALEAVTGGNPEPNPWGPGHHSHDDT